jgi:flavodoxin/Pyruvate/2-oxoacid:ferredoxin oxidoreductase delta subunit
MATCLVVYFSQGGTTRRVAEAIARGWSARGHHVALHDLQDGPAPDPGRYDVLGVGCPAHYYRPAIPVSDYLAALTDLAGKPVFTFVLHAAALGDAGNAVRRALDEKGGSELGYARFRGVGRFLGYLKHGYQFSPADPAPDAIEQAEKFGADLAARLAGATHAVPASDPAPPVVYRLERFLTGRFFIRHLYRRLFRLDERRCIGCGHCVKSCPTRNIAEDDAGRRVWGPDCILCFGCELNCPRDAISSRATWTLFWPFMVYNTRAAARDPAIAHVRVIHAKGRTTVVPARGRRTS